MEIGAAHKAALPALSFEGATRRNRPNLKVGDSVYARVTAAGRDAEPQLSCVGSSGKADGFGALTKGYVFTTSTGLARALAKQPPCAVLAALGR